LLDVYHQGEFTGATCKRIRAKSECRDAIGHRLRVAVDCCNGACSLLSANWLEALGCDVLAINDDPGSPFPHDPEPRIDTTAQVRALVRASQADIGFVHDADGERLGIVDESGRPFSEELTLALAATIKLREKVGPVVTNVSTTRAVDRIASQYGARVIRTPVGQSYISEAILENEAVIGGEGNGAVAVPEVLASHDAAAAMGLILEYLAKLEQPVSALVEQVPRLTMSKQQVPVEPSLIFSVLRNFRDAIQGNTSGGVMDLTDGVKIEWPDGWVHVRASNTESLIRIIVESESASRTSALVDWAREHLRS
jgi:phosphomannomutase